MSLVQLQRPTLRRPALNRPGLSRIGAAVSAATTTRTIARFAGSQYMDGPTLVTDSATPVYLEFSYAGTSTVSQKLLGLATTVNDEFLYVSGNYSGLPDVIKIESSGNTPGNGATVFNDGKLNTIRVEINPATGVIDTYVNGALDYSVTHSAPAKLRNKTFHVSLGSARTHLGNAYYQFSDGFYGHLDINGMYYPLNQNNISQQTPLGAGDALTMYGFDESHIEAFTRTYNPDAWTADDGDPVLEIV